ncbi:MAG: hypothetical protein PHC61_09270 [Chitinivibrionales bacterium]|nr:hypothetical protein [Chitinivibrionales bacterium]
MGLMLRIVCNGIAAFALCGCIFCSNPQSVGSDTSFTFRVLNIGQGLAQLGVAQNRAVAWDIGDTGAAAAWQSGYAAAGTPALAAIIISHTHADHYGNLIALPSSLNFTGLILISPYEDSTLIRNNGGIWKNMIFFRTIAQGDTLALLDKVNITCLWPPKNLGLNIPLADSLKNRYSLCFLVRYQNSSLIITSDIDSIAEKNLALGFGYDLAADFMVAPHHGSAGSVEPLFFGYVHPQRAIISCGLNNPYNLPASAMLDLLFEQGVTIMQTSQQGTITAVSDGYYWQWESGK